METDSKVPGISDKDIRYLVERLYVISYAAGCALSFWIFKSLVSWSIVTAWTVWETYVVVKRIKSALDARHYDSPALYGVCVVWTLWMAACVFFVNPGLRPMLQQWMSDYIVDGAFMAFMKYMECDGPAQAETIKYRDSRNAAIAYIACVCILENLALLYSISTSRYTLGLFAAAMLSWMFTGSTGIRTPLHFLFTMASSAALNVLRNVCDLYDVVEASLNRGILIISARYLCSEEQKSREQQKVRRFTYEPLADGEIRLLVILPSRRIIGGTVQASLLHVRLEFAPAYEALSYRWADPIFNNEILLDGMLLSVTDSALNLLLSRRRKSHSRIVWIDAICINQRDEQEKTAQVQRMHTIYERASRVILYPGENYLARLAAPVLFEKSESNYYAGRDSPLELRGLIQNFTRPRWKAIAWLLKATYFMRAWVVQEIVVAQNVELYLGGHYVPWTVFGDALLNLAHPATLGLVTTSGTALGLLSTSRSPFDNLMIIANLRNDFVEYREHQVAYERRSLEAALFYAHVFQASDPRDRIYALFGITNEERAKQNLLPDYSKSGGRVFQDVATSLLLQNSPPAINVLSFAGRGYSELPSESPSWVPDFHPSRPFVPYYSPRISNPDEPLFKASGERKPHVRAGVGRDSLQVNGVFCDNVIVLSIIERLSLDSNVLDMNQNRFAFVQDAMNLTKNHPDEHLTGNMSKLWSALVAGIVQGQPINEAYKALFPQYLHLLRVWNDATTLEDFNRVSWQIERGEGEWRDIHLPASGEKGAANITVYHMALMDACVSRRFAISMKGRLCLVPPFTRPGDEVFIPCGAQVPFIVRKLEDGSATSAYELIGEAYVHGIMMGEAVQEGDSEIFIELR